MNCTVFGVIADDVTGACDVAGAVSALGLSTVIILDLPTEPLTEHVDCVVIALRTRTSSVSHATKSAVAAAEWLIRNGATTLYQKYCSTFDSTDAGNIGPVADAIVDLLSAQRGQSVPGIGTPATPPAGRTQYLGHLFVGGRLLAESPLRNHPLTPMTDSDLVRVLSKQTTRRVELLEYPTVLAGAEAIEAQLARHVADGTTHVLVDSITEGDLDAVACAIETRFGQLGALVGGGAGLITALARREASDLSRRGGDASTLKSPIEPGKTHVVPEGRRLILSGSSSERTSEQVAEFRGRRIEVDPVALNEDRNVAVGELLRQARHSFDATPHSEPVLVTATASPESVSRTQKLLGVDAAARLIENALSLVASYALESLGVSHIIVAGGETSGAIATAVGAHVLRVGELAAPGVPWTSADGPHGPIALLLKSGNFGERDLFLTAWESRP